jgi:hypothetical protein
MKTERQQDFIQLTVPMTVRTNRRLTRAERYRTRHGLPTVRDMSLATKILSRLETVYGIMELSQPENVELLKWAHGIVNYQK